MSPMRDYIVEARLENECSATDETLVAVAEVIEALNADRKGLLGRESDFCCFCCRGLLEPRSRVVG